MAPNGSYTGRGFSAPVLCTPGTYQPLMQQPSCLPCPAGKMCPFVGMDVAQAGPAGSFCPQVRRGALRAMFRASTSSPPPLSELERSDALPRGHFLESAGHCELDGM